MKSKIFIAIAVIIMIAAVSFSAVSCAKQEIAGQNSNLKTLKPGVLTVGSDCTWPPMEYIEGDKIVGFDVDLMGAIAEKLGLKLDYQNAAWDGLFPALTSHKYDLAISSITITDERKKEMDFSEPYYQTDQAATVREGSGIDSKEALNGKKAGVQIGTTGEIVAREIAGLEVSTYDDILMAFEDLKAERIDAVIADSYVGYSYAKTNEGLTVGFAIKTDEQLGIAFAKDTPELLAAVNAALKEIKEDGTYDEIYAKWFGEK
jgi:polar amino acid transport system substrate-binding protein